MGRLASRWLTSSTCLTRMQASLLVDFEELHGVEVVGPLYDASQSVLGTFRKLEGDMHELPEDAVPITLHHADMLKWDWTWAGASPDPRM